jgi:hypothetical protein
MICLFWSGKNAESKYDIHIFVCILHHVVSC